MYGKLLGHFSEYVLKSLLFLDDKYSNILQATDLICYAFRNRWYDLERGKINDFWTNENRDDLLKCPNNFPYIFKSSFNTLSRKSFCRDFSILPLASLSTIIKPFTILRYNHLSGSKFIIVLIT